MGDNKGIPAWVWVGCGCLGALGAIFLFVVGLGAFGLHKATELAEDLRDPEEREKKAFEVLGADELPPGYYPVVAMSIPFLADFAILTDVPPDESGEPPDIGARGLIYMSFTSVGEQNRDIRDFFEGKTTDLDRLPQENIDLDLRERVANGTLSRAGDSLLWVAHRGSIDSDDAGRAPDGLVTLFLVECDPDSRQRIGIWFGPDPSPETPAADLDLKGTVGDPLELERFMEPLHPCP